MDPGYTISHPEAYYMDPSEVDSTPHLPGLMGRIVLLFSEPSSLFRALGREPAIWGALFLGAALTALSSALIPVEIWEEGLRAQALASGAELPADPAVLARVLKVFGVFGALVFWPVVALLTAGALALLFLFGMGYEGNFRSYFSMTVHSLLVLALAGLVLVPLKIFTGDPSASLSLAELLFFLEDGFFYRFARLMDLFNVWVYLLLGIGVHTLDPRRSLGMSIGMALGLATLFSLILAAFGGLGGAS